MTGCCMSMPFPPVRCRGRRILRFFANVAPVSPGANGARRWHVGEPFEDFAKSFVPRIGPHSPGKSWLFDKLGVTRGRRSAYDEMMLSLHDAAKRDAFQKTAPAHRAGIRRPAAAGWSIPTRCCMRRWAGEFALEQTFHLDVAQMAEPERAPIRVLERLSGETLV